MGSFGILTDPIWSQRASPSQLFGPRRLINPPISLNDLVTKVHVVVISHSHYDHLDLNTVQEIGNQVLWVVPLGIKQILEQVGVTNVLELDWWDSCMLEKSGENKARMRTKFSDTSKRIDVSTEDELCLTLTPAQHWSARGLFDRNKSLWGSFVFKSRDNTAFFGGDTAYCSVFKQIGDIYGPFDIAALPIGAYTPRWFMKGVHCNPEEALTIHRELKSNLSAAIHWGTFPLSDEDPVEPALELAAVRDQLGLSREHFFTLKHGETIYLQKSNPERLTDYATLQPDLYERYLQCKSAIQLVNQ